MVKGHTDSGYQNCNTNSALLGFKVHVHSSLLWLYIEGRIPVFLVTCLKQIRTLLSCYKTGRDLIVSSVQFSSVAQSCLTLCDPMDCSMPGLPVHHQLLEFTQTHVHWVSDAIQPSHSLSSPLPPAFNLSQHQDLFKWVGYSHQVAKYSSFSFNISPSNEYSGLTSFRTDRFDLLAVQRTLKSLLQHHSSKASILQRSAFFIVQLSHPYMTTGKTIAWLDRPLLVK